MYQNPRRIGFSLAISLLALFCCRSASAQADPTGLPIIGTWRINLEKSGPGARNRPATWASVFSVEKGGIRHIVYDEYPPQYAGLPTTVAPRDHTYWFSLNGKPYKDPEGPNGEDQTVSMWLVTRNIIFRQRQTKGVDDERALYVVSDDGKTLTWYVWNANPTARGQGNPNPNANPRAGMVWDRVN